MLALGKCTLDAPFFQAGLAGYSDAAMRLIARRHGAPFCVTEAMLDHILLQGGKALKGAELEDQDHPIAGQLMGSEPHELARAARLLVTLGYDVIDINLACPVKKIRRKARGGHLLTDTDRAIDILDAVRQTIGDDRPCTVKLRRAADDSADAARRFYRVFEAAIDLGYVGAVVHGRTVEQKYLGPSNWDFLRDLTRHYGSTPGFTIGGSGDIWSARDIFRMIQHTGVHLVSVARGCIGNPWIFTQARAALAGDPHALDRHPTLAQQRHVLLQHFQLSLNIHGEKRAGMMMRKFGIKFSVHHPHPDTVRKQFIAVSSLADWHAVLDTHYPNDDRPLHTPAADPRDVTDHTCTAPA